MALSGGPVAGFHALGTLRKLTSAQAFYARRPVASLATAALAIRLICLRT